MKIACFAQIGQFLKPFWVFSWTFATVHCLPCFYLSQTHQVTLEKSPFFHHFNFNLQEKCMGFLILTIYFMFFASVFLICEFLLSIVLLRVSDMGLIIFVEFEWIGFVDYAFKMLHFSVIMIEFQYWVCLLICNVLSMSYPLWSVLLPYVYIFFLGFSCDTLWLWVWLGHHICLLHDWIMCLAVYPRWFLLSFCTHCHCVML